METKYFINQYRYYNLAIEGIEGQDKGEDSNTISSADKPNFYCILQNKNIKQIGVQSLPGIKLYFNSTEYPIIIGNNGYFEIDIDSNITITTLFIDSTSRDLIRNNPAAMLLIDTIESN